MVTPELNLPKAPAIAGDAHEWKPVTSAHLFWVIPRNHDEATWNCELFHIEVTLAHATKLEPHAAAVARAFNVSVPALRNTRPIKRDEEIVLKWPKPHVEKPQPRGRTWVTAAQEVQKRQKTSN